MSWWAFRAKEAAIGHGPCGNGSTWTAVTEVFEVVKVMLKQIYIYIDKCLQAKNAYSIQICKYVWILHTHTHLLLVHFSTACLRSACLPHWLLQSPSFFWGPLGSPLGHGGAGFSPQAYGKCWEFLAKIVRCSDFPLSQWNNVQFPILVGYPIW